MKYCKFLMTCFLVVFVNQTFAEETFELFVTPTNNLSTMGDAKMDEFEKHHRGIIVGRVKYNANIGGNLSDKTKLNINLNFMNENIELTITSVNSKGDNYSYSASNSESFDHLNIAESNGSILGSFHYHGRLYKFYPSDNGDTVIIEMPSDMTDHSPDYIDPPSSFDSLSNTKDSSSFTDSESEYTVIVAYTAAFAKDTGNVDAYMNLLEQETNQSYINSKINTRVKIVHYYQTAYPGSGIFVPSGGSTAIDLRFFSDTTRIETQEFNNLRDQYNADIKILLVGNDGYGTQCGEADAIGANESNALAVVIQDCGTGFYSFGHEIGHLFGARHALGQDSIDIFEPFEFAHGFCSEIPGTFRTIMARGNCPAGFSGRSQRWSNPDLSFKGQITGSEQFENNAKLHNIRAANVANFRQEPQSGGIIDACQEGHFPEDSLKAGEAVCLPDFSNGNQYQSEIYVPNDKAGSTMEIILSHGSGNGDLLHRFDSRPSRTVFDHISSNPGNEERILVENVQEGWNYIHVRADTEFSDVTILVSYVDSSTPQLPSSPTTPDIQIVDACKAEQTSVGNVELIAGNAVCLEDVFNRGYRQMALYVTDDKVGSTLEILLSHGFGNGTLLHRHNRRPNGPEFDHISNNSGNEEKILVKNVKRGWNYIHVNGDPSFSGVTLLPRYIE